MTGTLATLPVFMDPRRIAGELVRPLRETLDGIPTDIGHYRRLRKQGEEFEVDRHKRRSAASKAAWETIRANKARRDKR